MRFESNVNRRYLPIPGLQRVFGIDQKTAEQIAQNLPRVVKRRVTLEVAAQYAEALREIGAEVQLRPCQDDLTVSRSTPPAAQVSVASYSPDVSPWGTNESASEKIPVQPSGTIDPDTPGSQTAQGTRQPVDDLAHRRSTSKDDDRLSRASTRPSPAVDVLSRGPLPREQQEQNATRAHDSASQYTVTSNTTNLSQGIGSVWPYTANAVLDSDLSARPSTADRSMSAADHETSPRSYAPNESIPEKALKKSLWAPGTGYVLAGSVLIFIGLSFDRSIFTGNTGITNYFFDLLGLCWIVWGLFKLLKRGSGLQVE